MVKYSIEAIIEAGRKSFAKHGEDFRMSDVAKELNTRASTLYRHVATKRELYFAMLTEEFNDFAQVVEHEIRQLPNPDPEKIIRSIGTYILEMSRTNFERFSLMFLTKPPDFGGKLTQDLSKPGEFEQSCDPQTIGFVHQLVEQMLKQYLITELSPIKVTYYLMSLVLGAGIVTSPYYEYLNSGFLDKKDHESFHEFVIDNSLKLLKS